MHFKLLASNGHQVRRVNIVIPLICRVHWFLHMIQFVIADFHTGLLLRNWPRGRNGITDQLCLVRLRDQFGHLVELLPQRVIVLLNSIKCGLVVALGVRHFDVLHLRVYEVLHTQVVVHCIHYVQFVGFVGRQEVHRMVHHEKDCKFLMNFRVDAFIA